MTGAPLISVVLPVFNAEPYVEEALRSILGQTFADFELIIINDGSTDGTLAALQSAIFEDARVVLISRENRGLVASLNEGIGIARGTWIARMDADDIAEPTRFERQLDWLGKTQADICGAWVNFFGSSNPRVLRHPRSDAAIKAELLFGAPFAHPTVMMKAALARQLPYDPVWEKCEDYDLWERAARHGWRMTNIPEVLLNYRQHQSQISNASFIYQQHLSQKIRRRYWEYFLKSKGIASTVGISEVMKLRETIPTAIDMEWVDSLFFTLLADAQSEEKETIFFHMTKLYLRGAAGCPSMVFRWSRLNEKYGRDSGLVVKIQIAMLSLFRMRLDSAVGKKVKVAYFYLKSVYRSMAYVRRS